MDWAKCIGLVLWCSVASAETFEERVDRAKNAEKTEMYTQYEASMFNVIGDHLASTMRTCFATVENPNDLAFTLVADIQRAGNPSNVEVSPITNISLCFAEGFKQAMFPEPPYYPGDKGLPITIHMKIVP